MREDVILKESCTIPELRNPDMPRPSAKRLIALQDRLHRQSGHRRNERPLTADMAGVRLPSFYELFSVNSAWVVCERRNAVVHYLGSCKCLVCEINDLCIALDYFNTSPGTEPPF